MEEIKKQIIFKDFSHLTIRPAKLNTIIKKLPKGEKYEFWLESILEPCKYPEEDVVNIKRILFEGKRCYCCAKEDRWYSGDRTWCSDISEVEEDWNGHVMYRQDEDKWYYRPWLEVTFLSGEKYKTYFDTDEELEDAVNEMIDNNVHQIGVNE